MCKVDAIEEIYTEMYDDLEDLIVHEMIEKEEATRAQIFHPEDKA